MSKRINVATIYCDVCPQVFNTGELRQSCMMW
ncbi:uncharacterized protein METZ01_LOCUS492774, partial [marine metagenome]